jgi:hypothetical protein
VGWVRCIRQVIIFRIKGRIRGRSTGRVICDIILKFTCTLFLVID